MTAVAVLGTGLLGAGFVRGFRKRGVEVNCWNRTTEKAKALESVGANAFANAADAVKGVSHIHIVLSDDTAVESVIEAARPGLSAGAILFDHSTVSPLPTLARFARIRGYGFTYISAPVFMGPDNAEAATGNMMVSCSQEEFDRVKPHVSAITGSVYYWGGDRLEKAAALKLHGNAVCFFVAASMHDLLSVQLGLGLDTAEVLTLLEKCLPLNHIGAWTAKSMLNPPNDYKKPMFELTMARKDLRLFQETAAQTHSPLIVADSVAKQMDDVIKAGFGGDEFLVFGRDVSERNKKAEVAKPQPPAASEEKK